MTFFCKMDDGGLQDKTSLLKKAAVSSRQD